MQGATPSLLGIAPETRELIYGFINEDLHNTQRQWQELPSNPYSGLLSTCRQLRHETQESVFLNEVHPKQDDRLLYFPRNKQAFDKMRSFHIQIEHGAEKAMVRGLFKVLVRFQTNIQEFGLHYVGKDANGARTRMSGCAMRKIDPVTAPPLESSAQGRELKWKIFRAITYLRNLRVLKIENANTPVFATMLLSNKPKLQAVSVRCDARTQMMSREFLIQHKQQLQDLDLLSELPTYAHAPPIRALELDAHAVYNGPDVVRLVSMTLKHLSWRVSDPSLQEHYCDRSFFSHTSEILATMTNVKAPLETLRLCITMPEQATEGMVSTPFDGLSTHIVKMKQLRNLEIHYSGEQDFDWFRHAVLYSLPENLQRLCINDGAVKIPELRDELEKSCPAGTFTCTPWTIDANEIAEVVFFPKSAPPAHRTLAVRKDAIRRPRYGCQWVCLDAMIEPVGAWPAEPLPKGWDQDEVMATKPVRIARPLTKTSDWIDAGKYKAAAHQNESMKEKPAGSW